MGRAGTEGLGSDDTARTRSGAGREGGAGFSLEGVGRLASGSAGAGAGVGGGALKAAAAAERGSAEIAPSCVDKDGDAEEPPRVAAAANSDAADSEGRRSGNSGATSLTALVAVIVSVATVKTFR